jgi:hypothetical protein
MSTQTVQTASDIASQRDAIVADLKEKLEALQSSERAFDDLRNQLLTESRDAAAALQAATAFLNEHAPFRYDHRHVARVRQNRLQAASSAAEHAASLAHSVILDAEGVHVTDNLVSPGGRVRTLPRARPDASRSPLARTARPVADLPRSVARTRRQRPPSSVRLMRSSSKTNPVLLDDTFLALELGHNHCGEHEFGIRRMSEHLGLPMRIPYDMEQAFRGLELSRVPARGGEAEGHIVFDAGGDGVEGRETVFGCVAERWGIASVADLLARHQVDIRPLLRRDKIGRKRPDDGYRAPQTQSTWDERAFLIATRDDVMRGYVRQLHAAWEAGDLIVTVQGSMNPFQPVVGLTLGVWPAVPETMKIEVRDLLVDAARLHAAAQATGSVERLHAAGRQFFACSPRWIKPAEIDARRSRHPVMFWLNPWLQNQFRSGWYTVEELDQWCAGTGPVVMTAEDVEARRVARQSA